MRKLLILHLSDVHFKTGNNPVNARVAEIANTVGAHSHEYEHALIVISGDVAFSGKKDEYERAIEFFRSLDTALSQGGSLIHPEWIVVPGNHDCNLSDPYETRDLFIKHTNRSDAPGFEVLKACLRPQEFYQSFVSTLGKCTILGSPEHLFDSKSMVVGSRRILVNRGNTAWLSLMHEKQGSVFIPDRDVSAKPDPETELSITVFHHPYNWHEASRARAFQKRVEEFSDLVFTGHEHDGGSYRRTIGADDHHDYIEGHVLQDSDNSTNSGFNLVLVDFEAKHFLTEEYRWSGKFYSRFRSAEPRVFSGLGRRASGAFELSNDFEAFLEDVGAGYVHPRVKLTLNQIFVAPNCRQIDEGDGKRLLQSDTVDGQVVISRVLAGAYSLLTGTEKSGRTGLAKQLFRRFLKTGRLPIYIPCAREAPSFKEASIDVLLSRRANEIYRGSREEEYFQLPRELRVIIIDDFHLAALNQKGKLQMLARLKKQFGAVVVLGDETLRLEDIASRNREGGLFFGFLDFQLLDFGRVLRDRLLERWILLGRENEMQGDEFAAKRKEYAHALDIVLGKNLIPAYPVFILIILQQLEASEHTRTTTGSYGYFYEYLITRSLAGKPGELDLRYNFLSELAWSMHEQERRASSEIEYSLFAERYQREFKIRIDSESLRTDLVEAGVLEITSAHEVRFKYKYNYYYFIARWLSQNLSEPKAREHIKKLTGEIHREDYANIVIFLSYLSKDPYILETMLDASASLFSDVEPCNMEGHISYLNRLQERIPELVCEEMDGSKSREDALRELDKQEREESQKAEELEELLKITRVFKTVDVLGQILKNYAGSMRGETKMRLARECVSVSLRSVRFFLSLVESNLEGFVDCMISSNIARNPKISQAAVAKETKQLLFFLTNIWCMGVIKRVSRAAGSQQLDQVYTELKTEFGSVAMDLIDVSVRLDHFAQFPKTLIEEIHARVFDNYFADSVLKNIVINHFYLFPVDFRVRDSICEQLGIKVDKPKLFDERTKKA